MLMGILFISLFVSLFPLKDVFIMHSSYKLVLVLFFQYIFLLLICKIMGYFSFFFSKLFLCEVCSFVDVDIVHGEKSMQCHFLRYSLFGT